MALCNLAKEYKELCIYAPNMTVSLVISLPILFI